MTNSNFQSTNLAEFAKYHGLGNDFIIFDGLKSSPFPVGYSEQSCVQALCAQHTGIGADGLIILEKSASCDFKMRYFNADGSQTVCGNGERCLSDYIRKRPFLFQSVGPQAGDSLLLETDSGNKRVFFSNHGKLITVEMGSPSFNPLAIPTSTESELVNYPVRVGDRELLVTAVGMGNPHAVVILDDLNLVPWRAYGEELETHELFPLHTNVEFIQIISRQLLWARVWERGVGETLSCGTGSAAILAAGMRLGLLDSAIKIKWPGGVVDVSYDEKLDMIYLSGLATEVFTGKIDLEKFMNESHQNTKRAK